MPVTFGECLNLPEAMTITSLVYTFDCAVETEATQLPLAGKIFLTSQRLRTLLPTIRSRPGKPNQRKGQNEKFMISPNFVNSGVIPWEKSTIHIELLFRNAPAKSS